MVSSRLLNKCVASLCKTKKLEKAEAVIVDGIVSGKLVDDVAAYNTLIDANSECDEFEQFNVALSLFEEMKKAGITPDVTTYSCLIGGATKRNLFVISDYLYKDMFFRKNINPDIGSYYNMMQLWFKSGNPYEAWEIFRHLLFCLNDEYSISETFNMVINGLCKDGSVDLAHTLFRFAMNSPGFVYALPETCNNLFNALCEARRLRKASEILDDIEHPINAIICNTVVKLLYRRSNIKQYHKLGLELISTMRSKGFSLDGSTYCTVISGLVKAGMMKEANVFKEQMVSDGNIQLDLMCYNTLLHLYYKQGNREAAKQVLEDLKKAGLEPDQYTHTIIINALCKAGDIEAAAEYFRQCLTNTVGFRSNFTAFNCMIDYFFKHGQIDDAMRMFEFMEEKDSITYTTMVHHLCKARRFVSASKIISACFEDGITIHTKVFNFDWARMLH